ncbi:anhydro-N-acetylmuramic acid kinase [Thermoleptolyngbya sichuanensis XZ-Cy5]|uniref:anhydro-N-acetylmuramic acid kinase n=1 Tax=Thermoleptolyngbya sichuanensis TaxID=2885951 RepID=UPI00240D62F4|nr:anhydro-N-acetylmuramic acid kinase [Thermoleptolyngbya sichuanensis]MDG2615199.1 anhydro-N-acetylmuramic acid kinase [Thermoleptolyngbya sichuanensis XZ-Cy5]
MRIIGLISGTSVDGIDAALVETEGAGWNLRITLLNGITLPYPPDLRSHILEVCAGAPLSMAELASLDDAIAHCFAQAARQVQAGHPPADLIGSHGQTVFHRPPGARLADAIESSQSSQPSLIPAASGLGYSLQLGRGSLIAHITGIHTISNFRAADIALGGQGAPLVPPVDAALLSHPTLTRCVQNIGGIGNVAFLPLRDQVLRHAPVLPEICGSASKPVQPAEPVSVLLGWDTGPGNALLDWVVHQLSGGTQPYDQNGAWAASGQPCLELVHQWLQDPYFHLPPPKSTGRELFGAEYGRRCLADAAERGLSDADTLATLTELTAASIVHSYRAFLPHMPDQVLLCGGGSRNGYLRSRLAALLDPIPVLTTDEVGLHADFKEAIAFAVLAHWRWQNFPGNFPDVTGAADPALLGEIHLARR